MISGKVYWVWVNNYCAATRRDHRLHSTRYSFDHNISTWIRLMIRSPGVIYLEFRIWLLGSCCVVQCEIFRSFGLARWLSTRWKEAVIHESLRSLSLSLIRAHKTTNRSKTKKPVALIAKTIIWLQVNWMYGKGNRRWKLCFSLFVANNFFSFASRHSPLSVFELCTAPRTHGCVCLIR